MGTTRCACGRVYSAEQWATLRPLGLQLIPAGDGPNEPEEWLETRQCVEPCGSLIARPLTVPAGCYPTTRGAVPAEELTALEYQALPAEVRERIGPMHGLVVVLLLIGVVDTRGMRGPLFEVRAA